MQPTQTKGDAPQGAESTRKPPGRARVKPRHLSPLLRQMIVEQFAVRQSTEDIAEELGLPVRTVDDVIKLHLMRREPDDGRGFGVPRLALRAA